MSPVDPGRRRLCLTIGSVLAAGLAGCSGDGDDDSAADETTADDSAGGNDSAGDDETTADSGASDDHSTGDDETTADSGASDDDPTEDDSTGEDSTGSDGTADEGSEDDGATNDDASDDGQSEELDLREANVVGVEYESDGEDDTFDVTLHHDDDGEDGYANWWQVERLDGTQLGRRDLLHAHSRQPFTRSETVTVPPGVSCVVVRGHDQTHGYGGQAMLVTLDSGATRAVEQGSDATSVEEGDCP